MDNFFINYCILVQYMTLIYFDVILPFIWFNNKGKLLSTHQFLKEFYLK